MNHPTILPLVFPALLIASAVCFAVNTVPAPNRKLNLDSLGKCLLVVALYWLYR